MHSRKSSRLWFDSSTKQNLRHSQSRWRLHRKITRHLIFQHRFVWRLNNFPSESLKTSMSKCQNVCCQRQRFCEVVIDSYSASLVLDYHQQPFFVLATKPKHLVVRTCPESHPDFPCKFQHSRHLQSTPSTLPILLRQNPPDAACDSSDFTTSGGKQLLNAELKPFKWKIWFSVAERIFKFKHFLTFRHFWRRFNEFPSQAWHEPSSDSE